MKNQMIKVASPKDLATIENKLKSLGYKRNSNDAELGLTSVPEYVCTYGIHRTYTIHRHLAVGYGGRKLVSLESLV